MSSSIAAKAGVDLLDRARDVYGKVRIQAQIAEGGWTTVWERPMSSLHGHDRAEDAISLLHTALQSLPVRPGAARPLLLTIPQQGADGFPIDVMKDGALITVWFGGLEEEFTDLDRALEWVGRALSGRYQLKIKTVGGIAREWRLEPLNGDETADVLARGQVMLLAFRKQQTEVRRNVGPWTAVA